VLFIVGRHHHQLTLIIRLFLNQLLFTLSLLHHAFFRLLNCPLKLFALLFHQQQIFPIFFRAFIHFLLNSFLLFNFFPSNPPILLTTILRQYRCLRLRRHIIENIHPKHSILEGGGLEFDRFETFFGLIAGQRHQEERVLLFEPQFDVVLLHVVDLFEFVDAAFFGD